MSYSAVIQPMQAAIPAQGRVCRFSMPTGGDSVLFADRSVDFSRFSVAPDEAWLEQQPLFAGQTPASDGISDRHNPGETVPSSFAKGRAIPVSVAVVCHSWESRQTSVTVVECGC